MGFRLYRWTDVKVMWYLRVVDGYAGIGIKGETHTTLAHLDRVVLAEPSLW